MNEDASRYFVTDAAQGYTGGKANGDLSTVAQYALSASDENAVFTVHYLDRETGAEVAIVVIVAACLQSIARRAQRANNFPSARSE